MMLENKIAVLTGGAQGLGEALALRLASEGCHVVIGDMNETGAATTAAKIEKTGRKAFGLKTDVSKEADVEALFKKAMDEFGRVDLVIANAAILIAEPIAEANASKWQAVMNVNLFGTFLTLKHAAKIMKQQKSGSMVVISSKSGKKGSAANSAYASSKFGQIGLVQSVALELAPLGIRCNAVCPGNFLSGTLWMDPEKGLFKQYLEAGKVPGANSIEDVKQHYVNQVPLRRGCEYEDVENVVIFLASNLSSYMTGQAVNVTGGQEMR
jgi:sorbitol-6-phosphate 2-dehydrogenase